jgi:DNA-binding CsgD family transcriptional regulator
MPYRASIPDAVVSCWLERADIPLFIITEKLRLIWANRSAMELMNRNMLRIDPFGTIKSAGKDAQARGNGICQQLLAAISNRSSWVHGKKVLTLDELPDVNLQLYELAAAGTVAIGCTVVSRGGDMERIAAQLAKYGLTNTERKIVSLLATGSTAIEIARASGSSLLTIRTHIKRAYAKMEVRSREKMFARLTGHSFESPADGPHASF